MQCSYSSSEIIVLKKYSDLFPDDNIEAKKILRQLQKKWHPDKNSDPLSKDVFVHIMKLYELGPSNIVYIRPEYTKTDNTECTFKAVVSYPLSFGTIYYSDKNAVMIEFNDDSVFLINHFKSNISKLSKSIPKNKSTKYSWIIPEIYPIKDANKLIIKMPDSFFVPLIFVEKYINTHFDYRLAFWIISRAFDNYMIFDSFANLKPNGCLIPLCFIDMKGHRMIDLSAFLFAAEDKLHALDPSQIDFYDLNAIKNKKPSNISNLRLIKSFGLKLLGDNTGTGAMFKNDKAPASMINFLSSSFESQVFDAYKKWQQEIVKSSFGKTSFYNLVLSFSQLFEYYNGT